MFEVVSAMVAGRTGGKGVCASKPGFVTFFGSRLKVIYALRLVLIMPPGKSLFPAGCPLLQVMGGGEVDGMK